MPDWRDLGPTIMDRRLMRISVAGRRLTLLFEDNYKLEVWAGGKPLTLRLFTPDGRVLEDKQETETSGV